MDIKNLSRIDKNRSIYIFGAGSYGKSVKDALACKKFSNIVGFIDSYKSGNLDGLPVIKFDSYIEEHTDENLIVIASSFYVEIETKLSAYGILDYLVV